MTAYALLLGIGAAFLIIGGLVGGCGLMGGGERSSGVTGLVVVVCASRIAVIVLQNLGIRSNWLSMCAALSGYSRYGSNSGAAVIAGIVGLAIGRYIVYWFASNGKYFS